VEVVSSMTMLVSTARGRHDPGAASARRRRESLRPGVIVGQPLDVVVHGI
jgi:hypothetical protein